MIAQGIVRGTVGLPLSSILVAGRKAGCWYGPTAGASAGMANTSQTLNLLHCVPMMWPGGSIDRMAVHLNGGTPTASEVMRVGIYADTGDGYPGTLIYEAGTLDLSSIGVKTVTVAVTLPTGLYWLAGARQGPSVLGQPIGYGSISNGGPQAIMPMTISATPSALWGVAGTSFTQSSVSGALPPTFTETATSAFSGVPLIVVRSAKQGV